MQFQRWQSQRATITHRQVHANHLHIPRSSSQLHTEKVVTYNQHVQSDIHKDHHRITPTPVPIAVCLTQSPGSQTHIRLLPPTYLCHINPEVYLVGNGKHQTMPGSQVLGVTHAGPIPGHVDSEACACSPAHLVAGTLIPHGKEGAMIIAVQGNVEYTARDGV